MQIRDKDIIINKYLKGVKTGISELQIDKIERLGEIIYRAYEAGKKIIIMGNGGSAATASHFVCDLAKGTAFPGKKRLRAFALGDNIPTITAYANDLDYRCVFAEQLKNMLDKGDVVIGISASGNSKNILKAIGVANRLSADTIGLTGFRGGKLKGLVSECLVVPSSNTEQVEDIHLITLHALKAFLISRIK